MNEIFSIKTLELEISNSVKGYDKKKMLPKIDKLSTMPKSAYFLNYKRYRSQNSIRQF